LLLTFLDRRRQIAPAAIIFRLAEQAMIIGQIIGGGRLELDLPALVDTRLLIQANSGGGKSWLLRLIPERAGIQTIVLDNEGEFASLREAVDVLLAAATFEQATIYSDRERREFTLLEGVSMTTTLKLKSPPHTSDGNCPACSATPPPQHPDACGHWGHFHIVSTEYQNGRTTVTWLCDICHPDLLA
jgi:uncharacterized protein DUF87